MSPSLANYSFLLLFESKHSQCDYYEINDALIREITDGAICCCTDV